LSSLIPNRFTHRNVDHSEPSGSKDHGINTQPSITTARVSGASAEPTSSTMAGGHLIENEGSSDSSISSETSVPAQLTDKDVPRRDALEAYIKDDVLRSDPMVADFLYEAIKGTMELATSDDINIPESRTEFSLIELLPLEAFGFIGCTEAVTTHGSSSITDSSSGIFPSSSSNGHGGSSRGPDAAKEMNSPDESQTPQMKRQKFSPKSGKLQSNRAFNFRCIHNALAPEIFCVNEDTKERFSACQGPGCSSIAHLKSVSSPYFGYQASLLTAPHREHMKTHHTKKAKHSNSLQCSNCQEVFTSDEDFTHHRDEVECPIRCLECRQTFDTKSLRTEHRKLEHIEEETAVCFMELDEKLWKRLNEEVKSFTAYQTSVKNGKDKPKPKIEIEEWIKANTPRYEAGRSEKTRANARVELGHWYTMCSVLASVCQKPMLKHPCKLFSGLGVFIC
jgi:hypothetical protein